MALDDNGQVPTLVPLKDAGHDHLARPWMKRQTRVDFRLGYISSFGPNKGGFEFFFEGKYFFSVFTRYLLRWSFWMKDMTTCPPVDEEIDQGRYQVRLYKFLWPKRRGFEIFFGANTRYLLRWSFFFSFVEWWDIWEDKKPIPPMGFVFQNALTLFLKEAPTSVTLGRHFFWDRPTPWALPYAYRPFFILKGHPLSIIHGTFSSMDGGEAMLATILFYFKFKFIFRVGVFSYYNS